MKNKTAQSFPRQALAAALLLELASGAHAAIINVDNNTCTLTNAITSANTDTATAGCTTGNGDDVIELPADSSITLMESLPTINNNVTINANDSIIQRNSNANPFTVLTVNNLATLTVNKATISGGLEADNYGAGILVFDAELLLNDSVISNNTGGALVIIRGNNSIINNVQVTNNSSADSGNYYAAGVSISAGNVTIENSTFVGNTATTGRGAGLYATNLSGELNLTINNSTLSGNSASSNGGGIYHYDYLELSESNININNSTIINNQSGTDGGGIQNNLANFVIRQSLISGNSATGEDNEINSIGGTFTLNDYNLIGLNNNSGSSGITLGGTDIIPTESNLNDIIDTALTDNGGLTPTHNLAENSSAIDAIMPVNCATTNDQIGNLRGNDGNGDMIDGCDIGAIEYQPAVIDLIFMNGFEMPLN